MQIKVWVTAYLNAAIQGVTHKESPTGDVLVFDDVKDNSIHDGFLSILVESNGDLVTTSIPVDEIALIKVIEPPFQKVITRRKR